MTTEPEPEPAVDFEDALKQLETIVDDLERGEPELSAALAKYEQGVRLLARCHGVLDQAERSVALLGGVHCDGEPIATPFSEETSDGSDVSLPVKSARKPRKRAADDGGEASIPF